MSKTARYPRFVCIIFLGLFAACAPKAKPQAMAPASEIAYEEQAATPTVVIPKTNGKADPKYQPLPKKIINTANAKAPVEIFLGASELRNSKISYSSANGKMQLTGSAVITNDLEEKIAEKFFALEGTHGTNENIFILREGSTGPEEALSVSAQANCLSSTPQNAVDCNHVMIDVYIFYKNKYYTEQIELNRKKPEVTEPPPIIPAPAAPEVKPNPQPDQNENEDHTQTQQTEEADESISGRYQGGAETIDLTLLFPQEVHIQNEKEDRKTEPVLPAPPVVPVAPTAPPAAVKSKDETKASPPIIKEKILSPDLKQTESGEVRPINQALGFPDKGSLRNATSVLTRQQALNKKAFFEVVAPERKKHFTTYDMAELLTRSGDQLNRHYSKILYISNLSAQNGGELTAVVNGKLTKHASHQNGLDADLAYPTDIAHLKFPLVVRMKSLEYFPKNYSIEKTYSLIKFLFTQKDILVDRFFIDQKIKQELCTFALSKNEFTTETKAVATALFESIQHVTGHGDHFHVRIKCSKSDPACRGRIYKKMESCKL